MCATLCNPDAPDCPCGFGCRFVNNGGADATWLCAPRAHNLCAACERDDDCAGSAAGARCIAQEGGSFCGLACEDGCCPDGYACTDGQCRPAGGGSCADCVDDDQDGYGRGEGCSGPDCNDARVDVNPGAAEQCNGRDDDCDGTVDESAAPSANLCLTDGVCRGVEAVCVEGGWRCGYPEAYEADERRCDGLDNDCDGLIDEVLGRGDPCEVGVGACRVAGTMDCAPEGGGLACSARPRQPVDEVCNGIDDDCDDALDEVAGVGGPCEDGLGACRRAGQMVCDAASGQLRCDASEAAPEPERCDNRDNDCDGRADEGEDTCPPLPQPEQCNDADDDLDGAVDEDLVRPCQSQCGEGIERCVAGAFVDCDAPTPVAEACNGLDDDCDGQADEAVARECRTACGVGEERCVDGAFEGCDARMPVAEACNGLDDDCDGEVDEEACGLCERQPDDTVVSVGEWTDCAYEHSCDEAGARERVVSICRGGQVVEEPEVEVGGVCARDTDGEMVTAPPWGDCGGFLTACSETGEEARTVEVCRDGEAVAEAQTRACERETDGLRIGEGDWGECGEFEGDCGELGRRVRGITVCRNGVEEEEEDSAPCERDTDDLLLDEGDWGACAGFSDDCDESGVEIRPIVICRDGQPLPHDESRPCGRRTDGVVVDEGDWGACAHPDECAETGLRERAIRVCRDGVPTEEAESDELACVRDTDGLRVDEGDWGECVYAEVCAETGRRERSVRLCRAGEAVDEVEPDIEGCDRDTEGTRLDEGEWGECGYADDCVETGRRERPVRLCRAGEAVDEAEPDVEGCDRDTEGVRLDEGGWGECIYANDCVEAGRRERPVRLCRAGEAVDDVEPDVEGCDRDTDERRIGEDDWGECIYADACTESGERERGFQVCRGGVTVPGVDAEACARETDGIYLAEGDWGECAYADACVETGDREREVRICRAGEAVDEVEQAVEGCDRNTEGTRLDAGNWGACVYVDDCVEAGRRERAVRLCRTGEAVDEVEPDVEGCDRGTEGVRLDEGDWGECVYADNCVEAGRRERTVRLCRAGGAVDEVEPDVEGCDRDTDERRIGEDDWGECIYVDACIESGERQRGFQVCRGGVTVPGVDAEACARETDGMYLAEGDWGECAYADACIETGEREREVRTCRDGLRRDETEVDTEFCDRETDGTRVDEGEWTACEEYDGPCDEGGFRTRPIEVCAEGRAVADTDREACGRDTDGVVVDLGPWGQCVGFDQPCGEAGRQFRLRRVCRNGQSVDDRGSQACFRETDGNVVFTGSWTACGYRDVCDEDAERQRETRVCRNGDPELEFEVVPCHRETNGTVVEDGPWTACDYSSECDERARRCHDLTTCRNGRMDERRICEDCRRNTDGDIIDTGDWGSCVYPSECSERGTRRRPIVECRDGWPEDDHQTRACNRHSDGDPCDRGRGTCEDGVCEPNPEVCDGRDNDGDGFIDNVPHGELSCFYFITHHTQCEFHSMHGVWRPEVGSNQGRGAFTCPAEPEFFSDLDCDNCPMQRVWCGGPEIDGGQQFYNTCWRQADGNMLRTYRAPRRELGFTRELKNCWNILNGENDYIADGRECRHLGNGWIDGPHTTMGYIAPNRPAGRFEEPIHEYWVCQQPRAGGFMNRWISRGCPNDRLRFLGWSIGP